MNERKCEQYWPTQAEKKKEFGHMEIVFKGQNDARQDFTQQKFEVKNKNEGIFTLAQNIIHWHLLIHLELLKI